MNPTYLQSCRSAVAQGTQSGNLTQVLQVREPSGGSCMTHGELFVTANKWDLQGCWWLAPGSEGCKGVGRQQLKVPGETNIGTSKC